MPIRLGLPFIQPQIVAFKAVVVEPEEAVIITKNTEIEFSDKPAAGFEGTRQISYEDIGGLGRELQRVRETIELPLRHPETLPAARDRAAEGRPPVRPARHGQDPDREGRRERDRAPTSSTIAGPEVISKYYGESEQQPPARSSRRPARTRPRSSSSTSSTRSRREREDVTGEVERRVVAQLLDHDGRARGAGQVVVIGATNRVDAIDPALRRGRAVRPRDRDRGPDREGRESRS